MDIGLVSPMGNSATRDVGFLREYMPAIEAKGFSSYWAPEHVVFFDLDQYESKYPYDADGVPPFPDGAALYDPLFVIAAAAQLTTTLRFATSVLILPQRPPLLTAKEVMTLDHLTDGRFEFGVGAGWSSEEYAALGVSFARRGKRFDEYIEAIRTTWTESRASYHGEFVSFDRVIIAPHPVTPRGPPILIGGDSEAAMRRAARLGDGWYGWWTDNELEPHLQKLRDQLAAHGREDDPSFRLKLGLYADPDPDKLPAKVDEARRLGVQELSIAAKIRSRNLAADLDAWAAAAGLS